jgi:hypothetical protein
MAIEDLLKKDTGKGVLIGLGVAVAATVLATNGRPMAKAAIKSGMLLYEKGMEKLAELNESLEDIVAEARAEVDEELMEGAIVAESGELKTDSEGESETNNESDAPSA